MKKRNTIFRDDVGMLRFAWVGTIMTLVVVALTIAVLVPVFFVTRHYSQVNCRNFASQTNRQTKWVKYSWWTFDCLTPTSDGKWISTSNLREFGDK